MKSSKKDEKYDKNGSIKLQEKNELKNRGLQSLLKN